MRRFCVMCIAVALVFALGSAVWAEPKHDSFYGDWEGDNWFEWGGGSGWSNGTTQWFHYLDPQGGEWWNQWFYDDPPDQRRWKEISYFIDAQAFPGLEWVTSWATVEVAVNWSARDFPATGSGGPPPMPDQEQFIVRQVVSTMFPDIWSLVHSQGTLVIPDYNPEWVSIDVRVDAWQEVIIDWEYDLEGNRLWPILDTRPMTVMVSGEIMHECVPEPNTLVLLGVGAISLLAYARRRRRS